MTHKVLKKLPTKTYILFAHDPHLSELEEDEFSLRGEQGVTICIIVEGCRKQGELNRTPRPLDRRRLHLPPADLRVLQPARYIGIW